MLALRGPLGLFPDQQKPRLYDRVVEVLRARHYSGRTEEAYVHWIRRFIVFHDRRHPCELAEGDVNRFLTHLAMQKNVAASTQNQALAGLLFLYQHVLGKPLNRIEGVVRARRPKRLPVVLTRDEVEAVLAHLDGVPGLVCTLLYGSGVRLLEGLQLRVKDLDFGRGEITVRDGKGQMDRVTMQPNATHQPLAQHLRQVREQHEPGSLTPRGKADEWRRNRYQTESCGPGSSAGRFVLGCPAGVLHWSSETRVGRLRIVTICLTIRNHGAATRESVRQLA